VSSPTASSHRPWLAEPIDPTANVRSRWLAVPALRMHGANGRPAAVDSATLRLIEPKLLGDKRALSNEKIVCRRCCGQPGAIASKAKLSSGHALNGAPITAGGNFLESSPLVSTTEESGLASTTANAAEGEPASIRSLIATSRQSG
jgi:hypothetical protein